jgi:hypothetical protein
MAKQLHLLVCAGACVGVAAVLWGLSPPSRIHESTAASQVDAGPPLDPSSESVVIDEGHASSAPNLDRSMVASKDATDFPPPDDSALTARRQAAKAGVVPPDLSLPDAAAWTQFAATWRDANQVVVDATANRHKVGRALAQQRFESGKYEEILVDESQRVNGGFRTDKMTELRHPDEWVALKMLYREGGGQRFHVVRIFPGDESSLDEVTMGLKLAEMMRKDAINNCVAALRAQRQR